MTKERWAELEQKDRHKLSTADWKEIKTEVARARITEEYYLELLNQYGDVIGLNPLQYPKGRRLPDPDLHQDPAFLAMKLGELEDELSACEGWNQLVSVCSEHTEEITGDGCVICELGKLEEKYQNQGDALDELMGIKDFLQEQLTEAKKELDYTLMGAGAEGKDRDRADQRAADLERALDNCLQYVELDTMVDQARYLRWVKCLKGGSWEPK
jgi:hypothetical protein